MSDLVWLSEAQMRRIAPHFPLSLHGYADMLADPLHAPGCLAMNSSRPCAAGDPLRAWLAELREQTRLQFRDRFAEARGGEGLPAGMDAVSLARLVLVITGGMAVEAQSGASRKDLHRAIDLVLPVWPDAEHSNGYTTRGLARPRVV